MTGLYVAVIPGEEKRRPGIPFVWRWSDDALIITDVTGKTLRDFLTEATTRLEAAGVYSPAADAELIAAHVLGMARAEAVQYATRPVSEAEETRLEDMLTRREKREPLNRIIGYMDFYGVRLELDKDVFEPLRETENLVEHALLHVGDENAELRILDIATGNGAMLLAMLKALPHASGVGTDIDEAAVKAATRNAEANGVGARAGFVRSDLANGLTEKFDLLLANPPFVPTHIIPTLMPEAQKFDPILALDGGVDGLHYYGRIASAMPHILKPNAPAFFQTTLKAAVGMTRMFRKAGLRDITVLQTALGFPVALKVMNRRSKPWYWPF